MEHENKVELIGTYGGDLTHALSAWTSTIRELTDEKLSRVDKLLLLLAEAGHHTPFEKSVQHFLITTDIATHIQLLKHRVGVSLNAESARYKELKDDKFYVPVDWPDDMQADLTDFVLDAFDRYHETVEELINRGFARKRAKESARFYLPYANQLTADVMFNFRSFMHLVGLRYKDDAQLEIRQLTGQMLQCLWTTGEFDKSLESFGITKELQLTD